MTENNINELYRLKTVSGSNNDALLYIKSCLSGYCDEIFADDIGNVYALKKGTGEDDNKKTVVLSCSMDTSGFVVKYVGEDGKILLHAVGNTPSFSLVGRGCVTQSGIRGVLSTDFKEGKEHIGKDDFYMLVDPDFTDIGAICLGEFVSVDNPPVILSENKICLGELGNKIFALSLIEIARSCGSFSFDVYFVFTAQHYLSSRGEKCAASRLRPDIFIALSLCENANSDIGTGVVVSLSDSGARSTVSLCDALYEAASDQGIACSKNAVSDKNSPTLIAPYAHEGSACAIIGAPCKKAENSINLCDIRDINGVSAAVCSYLIFSDQN